MFPAFTIVDGIPALIIRPDSITILKDEEALEKFRRYWDILRNEVPAKYLIAKLISVDYAEDADEKELWKVHDEAMKEFWEVFYDSDKSLMDKIKEGKFPEKNLLKLKRDLAWEILKSCRFCEWRCNVNRLEGKLGVCKLDRRSYISSIFVHMGEEAELVPSLTIFFSHCNFKCVYCQNWDISQVHAGEEIPPKKVAKMIEEERSLLRIRNVNWVGGEPTPNLHYILDVLVYLKANVPQVWNSNFYNSVEAIKLLLGIIDLWLPDFKYGNDRCALRLSKIPKYFSTITRNFKMIDKDSEEILIRHLVLPNHIECCTKVVLEWIANNIKNARVRVNVMEQYRPEYQAYKYPDISRRLRRDEWIKAVNYARSLGLSLTV